MKLIAKADAVVVIRRNHRGSREKADWSCVVGRRSIFGKRKYMRKHRVAGANCKAIPANGTIKMLLFVIGC
jgi:hypothetical protein